MTSKKVLVFTDSIGKYLDDIICMDLVAVRGARIYSLRNMIKGRDICLANYSHIIIHLGTNDIVNNSVDKIIADFRELIVTIKSYSSSIKIFISSILPRPVDFSYTGNKCKSVNLELSRMCSKSNLSYIRSFKRFFHKGIPVRSLFAFKDGGLHLNEAGQYELRQCFQHAINHM